MVLDEIGCFEQDGRATPGTELASRMIAWPEGKRFAFTVFDDTDLADMTNVPAVYSFLRDMGFRTTKTVWPLGGDEDRVMAGETCENPHYVAWLIELQREGFELAWHMATYSTSERAKTARGLQHFAELFGTFPTAMANHVGAFEGIYWGDARLGPVSRQIYNLLTLGRRRHTYRGHVPNDPLFWGDICSQTFRFVRNFTYRDINTLRACPWMPYHDPTKPYVNWWFAASEGADVSSFVETIREEAQDRLEAQGGACIMYTHFAAGFWDGTQVDPRFQQLMRRLSQKQGWFVPVSTLLDYLLSQRGHHVLRTRQRLTMELSWLADKIVTGHT